MMNAGASEGDIPLEKIRDTFEQAEAHIKIVESVGQDVVIPAINEQRNAGFHILRVFLPREGENPSNETIRAISHSRRASYEAFNAGLIFLLEKIAEFKNDYRKVSITEVIPDYTNILVTAQRAQDLLADPRSDGEERDDDFEKLKNLFDELKGIVTRLDVAREELNKKLEEITENKKELMENRKFVWKVSIVSGLIGAIAGAVLTAFFS